MKHDINVVLLIDFSIQVVGRKTAIGVAIFEEVGEQIGGLPGEIFQVIGVRIEVSLKEFAVIQTD